MQLLSLSVAIGDVVEAGQLLAELDSTSEQIKLQQAERALRELTSLAAIALAELEVALAEQEIVDARNFLTYQISPSEFNIIEARAEYALA